MWYNNKALERKAILFAGMAELADARDLKSRGKKFPYRFDPGQRQVKNGLDKRIQAVFLFVLNYVILSIKLFFYESFFTI